MRQSILSTREDLDWLAEVHHEEAKKAYARAIIHGNEDSPDKIELFARNHYWCKPTILTRDPNDGSKYIISQLGEQPVS